MNRGVHPACAQGSEPRRIFRRLPLLIGMGPDEQGGEPPGPWYAQDLVVVAGRSGHEPSVGGVGDRYGSALAGTINHSGACASPPRPRFPRYGQGRGHSSTRSLAQFRAGGRHARMDRPARQPPPAGTDREYPAGGGRLLRRAGNRTRRCLANESRKPCAVQDRSGRDAGRITPLAVLMAIPS